MTPRSPARTRRAVALIVFLILRMAQATQKAVHRPLDFARLVRANLMNRRPIDRLLEPLRRLLEAVPVVGRA